MHLEGWSQYLDEHLQILSKNGSLVRLDLFTILEVNTLG
jgi:hypothetical protein